MPDTSLERLRALEVQISTLNKEMTQHFVDDRVFQESVDGKLDELLELRNKGIGAFWLVSTIIGGGFVGAVITLLNWLKHAIYN